LYQERDYRKSVKYKRKKYLEEERKIKKRERIEKREYRSGKECPEPKGRATGPALRYSRSQAPRRSEMDMKGKTMWE